MKLIAADRTRKSGQQQCQLGWCWRSSSAGASDGGRRSQELTTEGRAHALRQGSPQPKAMGRPVILEEPEGLVRAGTYGARRAALTLWRHKEMQGTPGPQAREDAVQTHERNGRNKGYRNCQMIRTKLTSRPALTCCF
ncbi:hypothetical protein SETIT_8G178200v2 [Setaria italica]|uniref:Uncharacterized protein n=1 Tax=Setaria italica TaxID=4555 RepID=A0A368S971_SETIT|nr:hypothetical protein SETIT_8G178200v2 [Setaria italica]